MAGLLRAGSQEGLDAGRMPGDGAPGPGPGGPPQEPQQISPEQQAQYNEFVENGMRLIYDENVFGNVIRGLEGDNDPVAGLANTTAMIMMRLIDSMANAGATMDGGLIVHAGLELQDELADIAAEQEIHEFTAEEKQEAAFQTIDIMQTMEQGGGPQPPGEQAPPQDTSGLEPVA